MLGCWVLGPVQVWLWVHECNSCALSRKQHCIKLLVLGLSQSFLPIFLDVYWACNVVIQMAHSGLKLLFLAISSQQRSPTKTGFLWVTISVSSSISPCSLSPSFQRCLHPPSVLSALCLESSRPWHSCISSQEVKKLFSISSSWFLE